MSLPPIYIVSGGAGVSGEQVVRTALAQFTEIDMPVIVVPHVTGIEQIQAVVSQAAASRGTIVHTLVNAELREALIRLTRERNIAAIDLMGQLLTRLTTVAGHEPLGQPGLYRQLRQEYFDRIAAIEFTVAHDDGKLLDELHQAEIVLAGISRVGKTPLSMFLAMRGWKVANVPLITDIPPPRQLFEVDRSRVVGLTIEPGQLVSHRRLRQHRLGVRRTSDYTDPARLFEEVEAALQVFHRGRFPVIDVTDKPVEECAEEILETIARRRSSLSG